MKLLVLAKFAPSTHGGIETSIRTFAEAFSRLCPNSKMRILCYGTSRRDYLLHSNVVCSVYKSDGLMFSSPISFLLVKDVYLLRSDYDVVHLHLPNPWSLFVTLTLLPNVTSIATVHAVATRYPILEVFERHLRNLLLRRCSAVIVAAEPNIALFGLTAFAQNLRVVPFAPDRTLISMTEAAGKTCMPPSFQPFMLFVGRLVHYKGLEAFLPLMRQIEGTLVIAGDGPLYHSLISLTKRLGITCKVVLTGAVNNEELACLLHHAQFCLMPSVSRSETFGIAILEAMAAGKAVVASRLGTGLDLLVQDGINGYLIDSSDSQGWIAICNRLFANPALARNLGINGRDLATLKYSDAETHERVIELLDELTTSGCR